MFHQRRICGWQSVNDFLLARIGNMVDRLTAGRDRGRGNGGGLRCVLGLVGVLLLGENASASAPSANLPASMPSHHYGLEPVFHIPIPAITDLAWDTRSQPRLYVSIKAGHVYMIEDLAQPNPALFLDIADRVAWQNGESGLHSIAFHPRFLDNGHVYAFYSTVAASNQGVGEHDQLVRYTVNPLNPTQVDPDTEVVLFRQFRTISLHHGGDLVFGADGYLYLGLGDASTHNDLLGNSQSLDSDFHAGILRIDVDEFSENLEPNPHPGVVGGYRVPRSNPFVGTESYRGQALAQDRLRTEYYALGLRNPWKLFFDRITNELYCIDTGGDFYEEINLIEPGGNYGWAILEGTRLLRPERSDLNDTTVMQAPLMAYEHARGNTAITAGLLYRGAQFPEFNGKLVFADYGGNIGIMDPSSGQDIAWVARQTIITDMTFAPSSGEILLAEFQDGVVYRLTAPEDVVNAPPTLLSETGLFSDLTDLTPATDLVPYELNHPFWSDDAIKSRWFTLNNQNDPITARADGQWSFPVGTTFVKHFDIEMVEGDESSVRRLETRVLVKTEESAYGLTYRWGDSLEDAELVRPEGLEENLVILGEDGKLRLQKWLYPSRSECMDCHTDVAGHVLGFSPGQINRVMSGDHSDKNQIQSFADTGHVAMNSEQLAETPKYAALDDTFHSVEYRVKSYLAANCAPCHQPGGPTLAVWDARFETPVADMGLIEDNVIIYSFWPNHRLVEVGRPERSMLAMRLGNLGSFYMPPTGSFKVNQPAFQLLTEWIGDFIPKNPNFYDWRRQYFADPQSPEARSEADPDGDSLTNSEEFLLKENPLQPTVNPLQLTYTREGDEVVLSFPQLSNRGYTVRYVDSLTDPIDWRVLPGTGKALKYAAADRLAIVRDQVAPNQTRFYRVELSSF